MRDCTQTPSATDNNAGSFVLFPFHTRRFAGKPRVPARGRRNFRGRPARLQRRREAARGVKAGRGGGGLAAAPLLGAIALWSLGRAAASSGATWCCSFGSFPALPPRAWGGGGGTLSPPPPAGRGLLQTVSLPSLKNPEEGEQQPLASAKSALPTPTPPHPRAALSKLAKKMPHAIFVWCKT